MRRAGNNRFMSLGDHVREGTARAVRGFVAKTVRKNSAAIEGWSAARIASSISLLDLYNIGYNRKGNKEKALSAVFTGFSGCFRDIHVIDWRCAR
jgi:hypothetical protein